jgi:DNA-binding HxlR family transcriptional regulator
MNSQKEPAQDEAFCPRFTAAVELIGRRWSGAILRALQHGIIRFSDLREAIPALTDKMLSERLRELEETGLVDRTVIAERPVRVEYRLTPKGAALSGIICAIERWAGEWT